jgi:hypothetical protein
MRWRVVAVPLLVASCGGLDLEHTIRVGTDCPDPEVVARNLHYELRGGGTLVCNHIRVVSGPPHRDATWLECQPIYAEPPSERRKGP